MRLRGERIAEESTGGEFLGIHVLGERLRAALPERGCLVGDTYIPAMKRGARSLQAFLGRSRLFFDIGSVRTYLDANLAWLASRGLTHWAGEGACVGSAVRLEQTLVGQGAIVEGHGALERCVVWPGVAVEAPLADAVVLPATWCAPAHAKTAAFVPMSLAERVRSAITAALDSMVGRGELPPEALEGSTWTLERPKRVEHGDLATNVAMALTKRAGQPPRAIAEKLLSGRSPPATSSRRRRSPVPASGTCAFARGRFIS